MIVHRLFRRTPDGIVSLAVRGPAETYYEQGAQTSAPEFLQKRKYGLTAFANAKLAVQFMRNFGPDVELWLCEAEEPMVLPPVLNLDALRNGRLEQTNGFWPQGTVMYKYITPIAPVDPRDITVRERVYV